jgi:hypothetical protein
MQVVEPATAARKAAVIFSGGDFQVIRVFWAASAAFAAKR